MSTNAGACKIAGGVWVDDGPDNTSIQVPDPAYEFPIGFNFVATDTTNHIRPISTFATVAAAATGFQGIVNSNKFAGSNVEKKMQVYHNGGAYVFLESATAVVDGSVLKPWIDPATGRISNDTFEVTTPGSDDILTVCGDCICPDYENDPCATEPAPIDLSATPTRGAQTKTRVKVRWATTPCGG